MISILYWKSIGIGAYYDRLIRVATEEQGVLMWTISITPRWWARIGPDTDKQCIEIFSFNIPIYFAPWASDHIVHALHIDNLMLQCIDNSTHIATSINMLSGSKRIDGHCSDMLTFQYVRVKWSIDTPPQMILETYPAFHNRYHRPKL